MTEIKLCRGIYQVVFAVSLFLLFEKSALAAQLLRLDTKDVAVFYEQPFQEAAQNIAGLYPDVKQELESLLRLRADFRPAVIIASNEDVFEQIVGSRLIVAYAVPEKMLIVIDHVRSSKDPFSIRTILKHELCHLILHRHINNLPRWLDEGVSQWASGGLAELLSENRESSLRWAVISNDLLSLKALEKTFPADERGLVLAYEESRSLTDYIASKYSKNAITNILISMKNGTSIDDSVKLALGIPLNELEKDWQNSIKTWFTLFAFLISNIYSIIFFAAAMFTIGAYARYRIRKRRIADETEEEEELLKM